MANPRRSVRSIASRELWPAFSETVSIVSSAFLGALVADIATFWIAVVLLFAPTIFLVGYLVFLIRRKKRRNRQARGLGLEDWILGLTAGFLFGSTYLLVKLAPGIPVLWIAVAILVSTLFTITFFNVWLKRVVKSSLDDASVPDRNTSFPLRGPAGSPRKTISLAIAIALTLAVFGLRDSINSAFGSPIAGNVLLLILIIVDGVGGVVVPSLNRRADKRSNSRLRHYDDLKPIFTSWRDSGCSLESSCKFAGEDLVDALGPLYLTVGLSLSLGNPLSYMRATQHLQADRYQVLRSVMSRIYRLEDDHNAAASLLVLEITEEVRRQMLQFPSLSEWKSGSKTNYYQSGNIISAIVQQARIEQQAGSTNVFWGGNVFADVVEPSVRTSLYSEVSRLVEQYRPRVQDLRNDRGRVDELLSEMRGLLVEVLDQIDTYRSLDGKCDFEKTLS